MSDTHMDIIYSLRGVLCTITPVISKRNRDKIEDRLFAKLPKFKVSAPDHKAALEKSLEEMIDVVTVSMWREVLSPVDQRCVDRAKEILTKAKIEAEGEGNE